ncbi:TetR/AcrR family transcriptional regulator [Actinomycetospora endophytica]|uniref:TetR/AcrR family transcriptional regulator n=1 Tax=Actinomycetospora endophytica TaxID=2291215 RepID=A0ABS8P108_9PSEU|nr:TetR/AcrR family transcriptional regulator [Actinomycetospora endophytica]MCD2191928.1 TetR/AcrR family transcriptional regulator [Actinomycetospora endophytica]
MATRQKRVGEASRAATRRRLVDAAAQEFREGGYTATTISALARRAGVSVQTLYLAVGGKPALLRAVFEQALAPSDATEGTPSGSDNEGYRQQLRSHAAEAHRGSDDPRARLRGVVHVYRLLAERAAPWWRLYRDAAATEPEIAADWAELHRLRRGTLAALLEDIPDDALRPGLGRDAAVDTFWAIASPETYDLLVDRLGYTLERYEDWLTETLSAAVLA